MSIDYLYSIGLGYFLNIQQMSYKILLPRQKEKQSTFSKSEEAEKRGGSEEEMRLTWNLTTLTWQIHNEADVNMAILKCHGGDQSK